MAIGTPVCIGAKNASQANPTQITTTGAVPAGALVVFIVNSEDPGTITFTSVGGGGLTWQNDVSLAITTGGVNHQFYVASAPAPSGMASSTTLTITTSGSDWGMNMSAHYVEGVDVTAGRVDASQIGEVDSSGLTWTTGAGSTTNANDILFAQCINDGSVTATGTVTAPATELTGSDQQDTGNSWHSVAGYRIVSSAGSYTIAGTVSDSHDSGSSAGWVAYKEAVAEEPWDPEVDSPRTLRTIAAPRF